MMHDMLSSVMGFLSTDWRAAKNLLLVLFLLPIISTAHGQTLLQQHTLFMNTPLRQFCLKKNNNNLCFTFLFQCDCLTIEMFHVLKTLTETIHSGS